VTYEPVDLVEVRAWGHTVGAVAADPDTGYYAFEYAPDWVTSGKQLSPLLMPNESGVFIFPSLNVDTYYGLPALLADSLPDRFGNALVDAWMADQGVRRSEITALDRLAYAADRAMGAIEFHPPAGSPSNGSASALQLADLVLAARATIVGDLQNAPKDALHDLIQVGTSAGGARAKAVIAFNPATGQVRSGQLDTPDGFEHWLIKLDGVNVDPTRDGDVFSAGSVFGRVEYAYYLMATACGIQMTESRLLPEGPRTHFMTRRFDRGDKGERIHMQSLCGIAGLDFNMAGANSYSQYFGVIEDLHLGLHAREQAFRRVVFNVAAMNRDDHTKNLAFLLPEQGEWGLSPAFDITHAHNPSGQWTSRHQMSVNGKRDGIDLTDLFELADRFKVPGYRGVAAEVSEVVARWPEFAEQAGVDDTTISLIANDLAAARPH
jgi:serine/threonine-protein kinase HipA